MAHSEQNSLDENKRGIRFERDANEDHKIYSVHLMDAKPPKTIAVKSQNICIDLPGETVSCWSDDLKMRAILYEEDVDAVYCKRKGDKFLLKKFFNFTQIPSDKNFFAFIALGLGLIPFAGQVRLITGMPFAHVFLTVAMLPVSWMSVGLAVRGFLVCYYYPAKMKLLQAKMGTLI